MPLKRQTLWFLLIVALTFCAIVYGDEPLKIRVSQHTLVCVVARNPDNRWLDMGIKDYILHGVQLDGEAAPITHQIDFRIGCEFGDTLQAFCDLRLSPDRHKRIVEDYVCRN